MLEGVSDATTPAAARSAALDELLRDLNPEQRAAVESGVDPLLVVAGAGTGKTATLAHRVAFHIASGVHPRRILLLTFTRRAASEMLRRVDGILRRMPPEFANGASASGAVWGGTFHSAAARLLRLHGRAIGLEPDFTVMDRSDAEDMMGVARTDLGLGSKGGNRFPLKGTCLDIFSRCVNSRAGLDEVLRSAFPWCLEHVDSLRELFGAYVDRKAAANVLDYDDLLLYWHALLESPDGAREVRRRFDRVLVDEYQDTNALQSEILRMLCPHGTGLTAVGDDAQAIYSFRAATVRNMLDFGAHFPSARILTLTRNYRSTQRILDATNDIIALSAERFEKELSAERGAGSRPQVMSCADETEQADFIVERVLEHREAGTELKRQAVLFRAAHHSMELELELTRRNIPFRKYGGLRFAETAHVKDLLAVLRLAENPRDELAAFRVLLMLPGVGPVTARKLSDLLLASDSDFASWATFEPPSSAADSFRALVALLADIAGPDPGELPSQVHRARLLLAPLMEGRYDDLTARLRDLEQLEHASSRVRDRSRFLAEMALDPPSWTEDLAGPPHLDEDWLVLSTMHSAKGLEWDAVFVLHAADGNIPSDMATGSAAEIEEERRLFYVACTRARDELCVCHPMRYYALPRQNFHDFHGYSQLTRFLPEGVLARFDRRCARADASTDETQVASGDLGRSLEDVRRRIKSMW